MRDELKKDYVRRISQADSVGLITVLYDMTLQYLEDAKETEGKREEYVKNLHSAQDCINELRNSLNLSYDPAPVLLQLYLSFHASITKAIITGTACELASVTGQLTKLRDTYRELEKTRREEPLMQHAETVYAGLTYGREDLVESVSSNGENRGFLA